MLILKPQKLVRFSYVPNTPALANLLISHKSTNAVHIKIKMAGNLLSVQPSISTIPPGKQVRIDFTLKKTVLMKLDIKDRYLIQYFQDQQNIGQVNSQTFKSRKVESFQLPVLLQRSLQDSRVTPNNQSPTNKFDSRDVQNLQEISKEKAAIETLRQSLASVPPKPQENQKSKLLIFVWLWLGVALCDIIGMALA